MGGLGSEAQKLVWEGAIPLEIRLHESEITTLPPPPPALILGPRLAYLPLLAHHLKPYFSDTLPPGADTVWFDYKGLPLKWHIPIGVLFDLLCGEPERPWNLTVHFRGYPTDILSPCEDEDSVKWSFINSLKEAAYIINGNCKNIMNMSQSDQLDLWRSLVNGKIESFLRISSKLKLGIVGEEGFSTMTSCSIVSRQTKQTTGDIDTPGSNRTGRIPVRLYIRSVGEDVDDFGDITPVDNWDEISYINRPLEFHAEDGKLLTLYDTLKILLPELFEAEPSIDQELSGINIEESRTTETTSKPQDLENAINSRCKEMKETPDECQSESFPYRKTEIKLVRIQGIEPKLDIPFAWVVKNLTNPDHFLHISVFVNASLDQTNLRQQKRIRLQNQNNKMSKNDEVVLLDFWASPFAMRVKIVLAEKGIEFEAREEDVMGGKSELLLNSNPIHKKVPVLLHYGKPICESAIIVSYIDEVWPSPALLPTCYYARAQARFWADFIDKKLFDGGCGIWRNNGDALELGKKEFIEILQVLEGALGEKDFFGGDNFGFVDTIAIPHASWFYAYEQFGGFKVEDVCPKLSAWIKRCLERDSVTKSLPDPSKVYEFLCMFRKMNGLD